MNREKTNKMNFSGENELWVVPFPKMHISENADSM